MGDQPGEKHLQIQLSARVGVGIRSTRHDLLNKVSIWARKFGMFESVQGFKDETKPELQSTGSLREHHMEEAPVTAWK